MGVGTLTIYSASAGSGKTFTLAGIYLTNLFKSRYSYRHILAVTFTNKATAEMKSRILDHLYNLATGQKSDYLTDLVKTTGKSETWIRQEAREILQTILNDYSRFSVTTLDSFFQKILRAFTREVGLHSGFNVEIDHNIILSTAVDEMIASAAKDIVLQNWLTGFAKFNIEEEKDWNLTNEITRLAEELFSEKYKIHSFDAGSNLEDKEFLTGFIKEIRSISFSFENQLVVLGKKCKEIFLEFGLTDDMFYQKGKGIPAFVKSLTRGEDKSPGRYVREIENDPPKWSTGSTSPQLTAAINNGLEQTLREAIRYYDDNILNYKSAKAILSNIYSLGILSDISYHIHRLTTDENSFLLSDAGEVLYRITQSDQTPFIYEKVGNSFENFMIDEFQDTSRIQWENFWSLVDNSMAEGFDNYVVGDIKQSIYRWRNSDWKILNDLQKERIDNKRFFCNTLKTNQRSRTNIISFNNALFSVIPEIIDKELSEEDISLKISDLYSEAIQADPGICPGGYVRLEFLEDIDSTKWNEISLQRLPSIIESLQDKGYKTSDIGIIVRDNKEGAKVLRTIIDYSNNCDPDKRIKYSYNIVSNDSLLLSGSFVITFIISVISVLNDPEDLVSRAAMLRFYLFTTGHEEVESVPLISNRLIEESVKYFPEDYESFLANIRQLPVFEMIENIISFFGLGYYAWNVAYLHAFQDYVLSFAGDKNGDLPSFLEWFEIDSIKKSVVLPDNQNAIRVLTIHKSKGLEFKVVILPFLSWNLDHKSFYQPILWVEPDKPPFNKLSIIPVKYRKNLSETIFIDFYKEEKYSSYVDNINLLYVALTRAKDVIYGFAPAKPRVENAIASILKEALDSEKNIQDLSGIHLKEFYNSEHGIFEFGEIPENKSEIGDNQYIFSLSYSISTNIDSLKLKLHGENYFAPSSTIMREKINYGKLMHEVFESIITPEDIPGSVRKLVLEGKISARESTILSEKLNLLLMTPQVTDWFRTGSTVHTEAEILLPSGNIRRPDRIIIQDDITTIVDFKFGEEYQHYVDQVDQYRRLMIEMGYSSIKAFIWYVDKNKILSV